MFHRIQVKKVLELNETLNSRFFKVVHLSFQGLAAITEQHTNGSLRETITKSDIINIKHIF